MERQTPHIRLKLRWMIPTLLVLVLTALLVLWLQSGRLLDGPGRRWVERTASVRLGAEVRLGGLRWEDGRLILEDFVLHRPGALRLAIPRVEIAASAGDLLDRRIRRLIVQSPRLEWAPGEGEGEGEGFPERPPLRILQIAVRGGEARIQSKDRIWEIHDLLADTALSGHFPLRISALFGEEEVPLSLRGTGTWEEALSLTLEEARWNDRPLLAAPVTVSIPTDGTLQSRGRLRLEEFDSRQLKHLARAFGEESPLPEGWEFVLSEPLLGFRLGEEGMRFELSVPLASVSGEDLQFPLSEVALEIALREEVWTVSGASRLAGQGPARIDLAAGEKTISGELHMAAADPGELLHQVSGGNLPALAGALSIGATFRVGGGAWEVQADLEGRESQAKGVSLADLSSLAARLELKGGEGAPLLSARVERQGKLMARVKGEGGTYAVDLSPLDLATLRAILGPDLLPENLHRLSNLAGRVDLRSDAKGWRGDARLQAAALQVASVRLESPVLSAEWEQRPGKILLPSFELSGRVTGEGLPAGDLAAAGSAEFRGEEYRIRFRDFDLTGVDYLAPEGMSGFSGGRMEGRGTIAGPSGSAGFTLDLQAQIGVGEVLRGAWYADLSPLPLQVSLRGKVNPEDPEVRAENLLLEVAGIAAFAGGGSWRKERQELAGTLRFPDLAESASRLRPVLADAFPSLGEIAPEGALQAEVEMVRDSGGSRLTGEALPGHVGIQWPRHQLALTGLSGNLPFALISEEGARSPEIRSGLLSLKSLSAGILDLKTSSFRVVSGVNRFELQNPLVFRMADGALVVGEFGADLSGDEPALAAVLRLAEVDLGALTRELEWPEMAGRVSADLGRIRYRGGDVTTEGTLQIAAFGGLIEIADLGMESLFTDYATYGGDVQFSGIDLFELTRTFEFGEINGIADGYVRKLRLFGSTPSHFEAKLETRDEGRRNISVKALNNLTVISQGGLSAALSRGIYRFIDFYRYRKIGIYCTLRNDVFTLEGTAKPDSDRYLVYGGWLPPKIDIVAPAHRISFKEMLKRLERIERKSQVSGVR